MKRLRRWLVKQARVECDRSHVSPLDLGKLGSLHEISIISHAALPPATVMVSPELLSLIHRAKEESA